MGNGASETKGGGPTADLLMRAGSVTTPLPPPPAGSFYSLYNFSFENHQGNLQKKSY